MPETARCALTYAWSRAKRVLGTGFTLATFATVFIYLIAPA